jgi:heterotetrameric sarcosine oxidase gamma subunit
MARRASALDGHYRPGTIGGDRQTGVTLREIPGLQLHQIAAWPDTLSETGGAAAAAAGISEAPSLRQSATGTHGSLLRTSPLTWWLIDAAAPDLPPEAGTSLDLSHALTRVRIDGDQAIDLINRHLPLDLREDAFPEGSVATSALHHVGVTLWHSRGGFELFLPRGFALSLWQLLLTTAAQFGARVVEISE